MRKKIILIILLIIILFSAVIMLWNYVKEKNRQDFLSQLKGQIVFTKRDDAGVANIWKINADGTGAVMVYHNDSNDFKTDSRFPRWSEDGNKIYFISYDKDKKKQVYEMSTDGKNVTITESSIKYKLDNVTQRSRDEDIAVREGDVYYLDENGQEVKVYEHRFYDYKFNIGAEEASWSPDKEYIIFQAEAGIMIADKNGRVVKLTVGSEPDWINAD